ncbi:MAG: hypothetical protein ABI645_04525 [Pseudomonadota bacterium]
MPVQPAELAELLALLLDSSVEFVLVSGGAAVIHGAPVTTQDIDIVRNRESANIDLLLQTLAALDARLGRVDVLGNLHDGQGYAKLAAGRNETGDARSGGGKVWRRGLG